MLYQCSRDPVFEFPIGYTVSVIFKSIWSYKDAFLLLTHTHLTIRIWTMYVLLVEIGPLNESRLLTVETHTFPLFFVFVSLHSACKICLSLCLVSPNYLSSWPKLWLVFGVRPFQMLVRTSTFMAFLTSCMQWRTNTQFATQLLPSIFLPIHYSEFTLPFCSVYSNSLIRSSKNM